MSAGSVKVHLPDAAVDGSLRPEHGWHDLQVRWLIDREAMGSSSTVVGYSTFPPGAKHALHRHPEAEEWEYVIRGSGIKRVGDVDVPIAAGDLVFTPLDAYHGVANTSEETLETLWGYCGAASLEEAGYVLPEDDDDPAAPRGPWPAEAGR